MNEKDETKRNAHEQSQRKASGNGEKTFSNLSKEFEVPGPRPREAQNHTLKDQPKSKAENRSKNLSDDFGANVPKPRRLEKTQGDISRDQQLKGEKSVPEVQPTQEAPTAPERLELKQSQPNQGEAPKPRKLTGREKAEAKSLSKSHVEYAKELDAQEKQERNQKWNTGTSDERLNALADHFFQRLQHASSNEERTSIQNAQTYLQEEMGKPDESKREQTLDTFRERAIQQHKSVPEYLGIVGSGSAEKRKEKAQNYNTEGDRKKEWEGKTKELLSKPARDGNLMTLSPEDRKEALKNHPERRFEMPLIVPDPDNPKEYIFNPERIELLEHLNDAKKAAVSGNNKEYEQALRYIKAEVAVELAVHHETIRHYPASQGYEVLSNIKIYEEYASIEECKEEHPSIKDHPEILLIDRKEEIGEEKVLFNIGESDILVRNTNTREVTLLGEVKSGQNDTNSAAQKQLERAYHLLHAEQENGHPIRTYLYSQEYNHPSHLEITNEIKASSFAHTEKRS